MTGYRSMGDDLELNEAHPIPVIRVGGNGTAPGRSLWMWCPGCDGTHRITVDSPNGWTWDGDETAPTISPSILVNYGPRADAKDNRVCHSFLVAGHWQFLGDCTHPLSGQTVPMVPLPGWLNAQYVS